MYIEKIKELLEKRIESLVIDKNKTNYQNGQIWARKDELNNLLTQIKKLDSQK